MQKIFTKKRLYQRGRFVILRCLIYTVIHLVHVGGGDSAVAVALFKDGTDVTVTAHLGKDIVSNLTVIHTDNAQVS